MYTKIFEQLFAVKFKTRQQEEKVVCPFHDDHDASLSINKTTGQYQCFGCHKKGNATSLYKLAASKGLEIVPDGAGRLKLIPIEGKLPDDIEIGVAQNPQYTLETYADEKKLNPELLKSYGVSTASNKNNIIIDYLDRDGKPLYKKYRAYNKKIWSDKDIKTMPYGLWLIDKFSKKEIWIVEGESDSQTLWHNEVAALGLPGATSVKPEWFEHIEAFDTIYVVCEADNGGKEFIKNIYTILRDTYPEMLTKTKIVFPRDLGKKDINELWCIKPVKEFFLRHKLSRLKAIAIKISVAYDTLVEDGKWFDWKVRDISQQIFISKNLASVDNGLWQYSNANKQWELIANENIFYKNLMTKEGINKTTKQTEVKNMLQMFIEQQEPLKQVPEEYIFFQNADYNYKDNSYTTFNENYFVTARIPHNHTTSATSFIVDRIFSDWVEDPIYLYEAIGYSFLKSYPKNKFFILYGLGGNGKTTFQNLLQKRILSEELTSSVGLSALLNDRFASSSLYQKYVNFSGEMPSQKITDTTSLKELTGDQTVTAQFKFRDAFTFKNYAKLFFSTNKVPPTSDETEGFKRRVIVIEFKPLPSTKQDPYLLERFTETDIEYIIHKSVEALHQLYLRGFVFTIEKAKKMSDVYNTLSNPVANYIKLHCVKTESDTDYINVKEFYDNFSRWLAKNMSTTMKYTDVAAEMKELGFEKERLRVLGGERPSVYTNIRYRSDFDDNPTPVEPTAESDGLPF